MVIVDLSNVVTLICKRCSKPYLLKMAGTDQLKSRWDAAGGQGEWFAGKGRNEEGGFSSGGAAKTCITANTYHLFSKACCTHQAYSFNGSLRLAARPASRF